jgi:hypothetical protein
MFIKMCLSAALDPDRFATQTILVTAVKEAFQQDGAS